MTVKDVNPGKYKPKCGKCQQRFALTVYADPTREPLAEKIARADEIAHATVAAAPEVEATMPAVVDRVQRTSVGSYEATVPPEGPQASEATLPQSSFRGDVTEPAIARDQTQVEFSGPESAAASRIPDQLGGYKLMKELGRGAMGAVYLAKQLSLDRNVALKIIQAQWARDPAFIARFTREAYAAAQLTHHNVVQIYDLGSQGDTNFFSMEFVSGESLADRVQKLGKLDPEEAVGYVLQAARGLNFAHERGMVHRDVKPANLMLNEHGIVKVADMGLVKTPQPLEELETISRQAAAGPKNSGSTLASAMADVTLANVAMGTPAYMAPEQAENAAGVDHRADIYSLGCTLYVLLTGRPPFEGTSAIEVITKHRTAPIIRPDAIVKRIDNRLSEIVLKMVAKKPEDRFQSLAEVIEALENYLGVNSSGPFSPTDAQVQVLELSLASFNGAPLAKIWNTLTLSMFAGWMGLTVLLLLVGLASSFAWYLAGLLVALGPAAIASNFIVSGLATRSYLFDRARGFVFSRKTSEWFTVLLGVLIAIPILWLIGWFLPVVVGLGLGAILGVGLYISLERPLALSRRESVAQAESLLKTLRVKGVDDLALQQFIVKYSGDQWEQFFESLFGYEALIKAREELRRTEQGRRRARHTTWRDRIIRWIDARLQSEREERDRKHLQRVEEEGLKARGVNPMQARREAARIAEALVEDAAENRTRQPVTVANASVNPKVIAAAKRSKQLKLLADARSGAYESKRRRKSVALLTGPLGFILSGKVRFLVGAALIAAFVLWLRENGVDAPSGPAQSVEQAKEQAGTLFTAVKKVLSSPTLAPVPLPIVGPYLSSLGCGIAGVILLVLGLYRGWWMSFFAWPAALTALLTPILQPGMESIGYPIAAALAVLGVFFGRTRERL